MKKCRKFVTGISAVLLAVFLGLSAGQGKKVFASAKGDGHLIIQLNDLGTTMEGVEFTAYKVAATESMNHIKTASEWDAKARRLTDWAERNKVEGVSGETNADGRLTFRHLEEGVYLVVQTSAASYGSVSPFLAAIPYQADGVWTNEVVIHPKGELIQENTNPGVKTGDESHAMWYIILASGSLLCGGAVAIYKKRKKHFRAVIALFLGILIAGRSLLPVYATGNIPVHMSENIPEWATNVVVENPPDDQYVYQFSDVCHLYQRGQYRFDCGAYNCAPSPIILLIDGSKYNASSGKTWTANGIEYVSGVSNYELTYCADFDTDTVADQFYKKVNVEDSTYFESVEDAYRLRAIVGNTYPFVSAVDIVQKLYEQKVITDSSILLNGKTFTDELTTEDIDVGQLIAASQMAIWVVCNDTMNSASVKAGRHTYHTLHPDNTSMQPEGKLNQVKGYPNANDKTETEYDMTEGQASNINAIYQYLMGLSPVTEEEADRNQQLVITDVDYGVIKTGSGNYDLTVKTLLNTAIKKNDNVTMRVYASKTDGAGNVIEDIKVFQSEGNADVIGKEFSFDLKDVPAGSEIRIELTGEQYLNQGVYFYEPYLAEGETQRSTSQNMVGASVGYTPVKAEAAFQIDDDRTVFQLEKYTEVDGTRVMVEGAEFEFGVFDGTNYKPIFTNLLSDSNGQIYLEISENQLAKEGETYYFKETNPAPGYEPLENPIFSVEPGKKIEVKNDAMDIVLPATGGIGTIWHCSVGMMLGVLCFGMRIYNKKYRIKNLAK